MEAPSELTEGLVMSALSDRGDGRKIRMLLNGNAVATYVVQKEEEGQAIAIHYWEIANPLPPRQLRLAIFSYTVLASQDSAANTQAELQLLDSSICEAEFSQEMRQTLRAPAKPWWKFW
jgi:hypothetical protein